MTMATGPGQQLNGDSSHGDRTLSLKPGDGSRPTMADPGVDTLAIESLSIRSSPLPHERYPAPQLEHYHPGYQPEPQRMLQQHQQQHVPYSTEPPHVQSYQPQQQQQQQRQSPPQQQSHQPQYQLQHQLQQQPSQQLPPRLPQNTLTTITATIALNNDQTRSISFEDAQRQQQKKQTQLLSPAIAAQVLTPAQQREIEADAYIQRGIELHEQDQLEEATYYFRLAANSGNPVGQLMYGLSLRHGWGCTPNPKDAIFYLQRAAASAMNELKELIPGSSANIKALQQQHQQQQGISASSTFTSASSQPLQRMGTIDRRSDMLTAKRELVMALYELGMSFLKGWGVQKDKIAAFHYFKLAADLGDADSQNETAQCFLDGVGTDKNAFEAARYYRLASAQGASQLGNSWIWKPKYDQYCEQQAAITAAESVARNGRQDDQDISGGGPSGSATSITTGLASLTTGILAAPSAAASSSLASSVPGSRRNDAQSLEQKRLSVATGRAAGPAARQGRYSLAGDLISSSQLELKIRQAEQLTKATVGPALEPTSATGKKKHRWSLWGSHHHNHDREHRKAPSFG